MKEGPGCGGPCGDFLSSEGSFGGEMSGSQVRIRCSGRMVMDVTMEENGEWPYAGLSSGCEFSIPHGQWRWETSS